MIVFVFVWSISSLSSAQESRSGILLGPDEVESVVKKLLVSDCRAVRGFLGTPVDGSISSWDYRGRIQEYPNAASDGVVYSFNNNDGLHITLGDDDGFDAVVLRGGARTKMYVDTTELTEPKNEKPLWVFEGGKDTAVVQFGKRVKTKRISFFGTEGGTIADVAFYRVEKQAPIPQEAELWSPGGNAVELRQPQSEYAPESLYLAMQQRYAEGDRRVLSLTQGREDNLPVRVHHGETLHLITQPFEGEKGLAAVTLGMTISDPTGPFSFTAAVHDPLDPRLDLVWLDFYVPNPGGFRVKLDFPDEVLLKDSQLWLTLRFDSDVTLTGPQGGAPEFWLDFVPREKALPEALAWRKLLLKSFFSLLSEPRPWGAYQKQSREAFYASSQYAKQCPELFMTIDQCNALDSADDMVRQCREWIYLKNLEALSDISPPPPPPEGVPAWAWYPRLAWLEVRRIADWWIKERMVPTGEFGGRVGDDSDLYQQFADLPFFETDGVAAKLMDGAARMAELAERENLQNGLNRHTTDSLHAYEEGINHLALMARWFYGEPIYFERCMESARNMEKLTILTEDGRRHFRNKERMGAEDMVQPRAPSVDGGASPLM